MTVAFSRIGILAGTNDGGGDDGQSYRLFLPAAVLSAATGNQGTISIVWPSANAAAPSNGFVLSYIGQGSEPGGSNGPIFTGNQVQVKWGGAATLGIPAGGSIVGTIVGTTLTLTTTSSGTAANIIGAAISGSGISSSVNCTVVALLSGSVGANLSTYSLSVAPGNITAAAIAVCPVSTSDVFTLGETFDNTHGYVLSIDTNASFGNTGGAGAITLVGTTTGVNFYFVGTSGGASITNPGVMTELASQVGVFGALTINAAAAPAVWGWQTQEPQGVWPPTASPTRRQRAAGWMVGDPGNEAQFAPPVAPLPFGWEFVPPTTYRRLGRAAAWLTGELGNEAKFIPPSPVIWGWEQPALVSRWLPSARRVALDGDVGFVSFNLLPWWESQDWSTRFRRYTQHQDWNIPAVFVPPVSPALWGWDPTLLQMPRQSRGKATGAFVGDGGTQAPLINFLSYGWPVQPWQPPHPRPERSGAWMRGDDGTQNTFSFTVPPAWGWDVQPVQPPFRINRLPAMLRGDDGAQSPFIMWRNAGWEVAPHQPGHPRTERAGAVMLGAPGNEAPFVFNFIPLNFWEVALPPAYRRRWERSAATMRGDDGTQAALINWSNFGWPIAPHQPQHPRPERAASIMAGDPGNENVYTFTVAPILPGWEVAPALAYQLSRTRRYPALEGRSDFAAFNSLPFGWEVQSHQPQHPRTERGGAIMPVELGTEAPFIPPIILTWGWDVPWAVAKKTMSRHSATEGRSDFVSFNSLPFGWEVAPHQPRHPRPESGGAWMVGDAGTEAPFIFVIPPVLGWDIQSHQPRHPRPERAAAWLMGDTGTEAPFVFNPFTFPGMGWDVPFYPPRRFLRIPAFLQGDPGNQATLQQWFNAGWEVQPPQPPHPRPERSAGFLIGDDGDYSPFIYVPPFSLFGWDSNVPQPRYARWGRGAMPFPVGLEILIPGSFAIPTQIGCIIYGRASRPTFYGRACECSGAAMATIHPQENVKTGDTWQFQGNLSYADGTPFNLAAGCSIRWGIEPVAGGDIVSPPGILTIGNGITVLDAAGGICLITVPPVQSRTIPVGDYVDQLQATDPTGYVSTQWTGPINVYASFFS